MKFKKALAAIMMGIMIFATTSSIATASHVHSGGTKVFETICYEKGGTKYYATEWTCSCGAKLYAWEDGRTYYSQNVERVATHVPGTDFEWSYTYVVHGFQDYIPSNWRGVH